MVKIVSPWLTLVASFLETPHIYTVYYNSSSVCLHCRLQFLLDRLGRCLKMFVSTESTSSHEFATQFGLDIFYMGGLREKHPKLSSAITEWPAHLFI